jgi:membrane-bound serine protease (ClpP class)
MARRTVRYLAIICIAVLLVLLTVRLAAGLSAGLAQQPQHQQAIVADINGGIGPAAVRHVADALDLARARSAEVVVLRINTPGGLETSMRDIITEILASPVPVVGYVAPSGGDGTRHQHRVGDACADWGVADTSATAPVKR